MDIFIKHVLGNLVGTVNTPEKKILLFCNVEMYCVNAWL